MSLQKNEEISLNRQVYFRDGKALSADLFIEDRAFSEKRMREIIQRCVIGDFGFGLLKPRNQKYFNVEITEGNTITVMDCLCMLKDGRLIEIPYQEITLKPEVEFQEKGYFWLVVSISNTENQKIGTPNSKQKPVFHPYIEPSYNLDLIAEKEWNLTKSGQSFFPLALLEKDKFGKFKKSKNYIPPCATMNASQILIDFHTETSKLLKDLLNTSYKLIRNSNRDSSNSYISTNISLYLEQHLNDFDTIYKHEKPVYTYLFFQKLARSYYGALKKLEGDDKNKLQHLIQTHTNLSTYKQNKVLTDLIDTTYNHFNLNKTITTIEKFIFQMINILKILEEVSPGRDIVPPSELNNFIINVDLQKN